QGGGPAPLVVAPRCVRLERGMPQREPRAVAQVGEGHRHQGLGIDDAGTFGPIGKDESLGRRDLAIDAPLGDDGPVARAHAATPGAARPHIHLAGQRRDVVGRPPAGSLPDVGPGGEYPLAWRGDIARQDKLVGDRFCASVHGFLWNSASTTISIASPRSGGRPKSTGLMLVRAFMPMRGCPAKPLPAPTSSTSKVTGRVLPIRLSVPSTLPLRGPV